MEEKKEEILLTSDGESSNGSIDCKRQIQNQSLSAVDLSQNIIKGPPTLSTGPNLFTSFIQTEPLKNDDISPVSGNEDVETYNDDQVPTNVKSVENDFLGKNEPQLSVNEDVKSFNDDQVSTNVKSAENDFLEKLNEPQLSGKEDVKSCNDDQVSTNVKSAENDFLEKDEPQVSGNEDVKSCNDDHVPTNVENAENDFLGKVDSIDSGLAIHGGSGEMMAEDVASNLPRNCNSNIPLVNYSDSSVSSDCSIELIANTTITVDHPILDMNDGQKPVSVAQKKNSNLAISPNAINNLNLNDVDSDIFKNCRPESPIIISDSSLEMVEDMSVNLAKNSNPESPQVISSDASIELIDAIVSGSTLANKATGSGQKSATTFSNLVKNSNPESPVVISSDSSVEMIETNTATKVDDSTLDMNKAVGSEQKSAPTSPDSNLEVNENSINILEISRPPSPASSVDSNSGSNDIETVSRASKNSLTLPYFHLPNPDFDEFVTETERNLHVPDISTGVSSIPRRTFEPKDKSDIVFLFDSDASKSNRNITDASSNPRRIFEDASKSNSNTTENNASSNEYQSLISCIEKLDDSKSPGIKRLVLKDYLKKKIEEKKVLAFERAKKLSKVDDEEEVENEEEIENEEEVENEETMFESESSEDDSEEPTVSFDKTKMDTVDMKDFNTGSPELSNDVDNRNDDDSDDDFLGLPKTRKIHILEDESSDESCQNFYYGKSQDEKSVDENSVDAELPCPPCYSPTDPEYEVYDPETNGPGIEINSSIPSYQPGGGFNSEKDQDFDGKEKNSPEKIQALDKYLINKNSSNRLNIHDLEEAENEPRSLGLSLDDLPISQKENESDLFSTQDLETVCSGVFKGGQREESDQFINEQDEGPQEKIQDFFEVEAELSGEDEADDEQDDFDEGNDDLDLVDDNEMFAEEELRDEIAGLHMKKVRDDDEELLKNIQEQLLEDGELNNEGEGRKRKFAWLNNDASAAIGQDSNDSSSGSDEELDDKWSAASKERAKWCQEKAEEDLSEDILTSYKKPHLKLEIIGKSGFSQNSMDTSKSSTFKRPRGSFLSLNDSEVSHVLKKLKTSDDSHGGSRTTKHFVFRNDATIEGTTSKESSRNSSPGNINEAGTSGSVFNAL